jgi:AAA+ ATPase superfamily predicted ATPase
MFEIEFHNRDREIREIMNILSTRPDLITFIYGPINSGKTELVNHLIKRLPKDYRVFYINLRGVYVSKAEDFLKVLFDVRGRSVKDCIKFAIDLLPSEVVTPKGRIPIPKQVLKQIFKEKELENVFTYLENFFTEVAKKKNPILILDELQKIGDVKIDSYLIYELFNFFVRLTKELHLCHVFVVTSDSLFIEKVYTTAMLHGRCRYLLVDDFDYNTTAEFLKKYEFSKEEIKLVWDYFGGKPVYLVEAVKVKVGGGNLKDFAETNLFIRIRQMKDVLYELEEKNRELFNKVLKLFKIFKDRDLFVYEKLGNEIRFCIDNNILFADPVKSVIKPQSKLDLLAIRKIVEDLKKP